MRTKWPATLGFTYGPDTKLAPEVAPPFAHAPMLPPNWLTALVKSACVTFCGGPKPTVFMPAAMLGFCMKYRHTVPRR